MIQIRLVEDSDESMQLQFREREFLTDASGAFCGVSDWSEWSAVPIVRDPAEIKPVVEIWPREGEST